MATPVHRLLGLLALLSGCASTCNSESVDEASVGEPGVRAFEPGPPVAVVTELPDPLWARELSRLPKTAQQIVLVNPEKLGTALAGGPLRERLETALADMGGPLVLALLEGLVEELDASRPVAIGALAYPDTRQFDEARLGAVVDPNLVPPFVQTRVLVPTRDPNALLNALAPAWSAIGLAPTEPSDALRSSLGQGGRLLTSAASDTAPAFYVIVIPEDLGIRAEVLYGDLRPGPRLDAALRAVAGPPREDPWTETPAVRHLLVQRPMIGTLSNPDGAAAMAFGFALMEADQAVRSTGSELTPVSWVRGLSMALASLAILDPRDRVYADSALTLDLGRGFDLRTTTSLTTEGSAVADAALAASGHVFAPTTETPSLLMQSGESMRASVEKSQPLRFGRQSSDEVLTERWAWAGAGTTTSGLASSRWPMLKTLSRVFDPAELDVAALLPDAYTLVVHKENASDPEPTIAVALDYEQSVDVSAVKTAIETLDWPAGATPTVSATELHGRKLVLVGIGAAAESLIDTREPRRTGSVERVRLNPHAGARGSLLPPAWASWFESIGPSWAAWTDAIGRADFVQVHHGASLVGHGVISLEGGAKPETTLQSFSPGAPEPTVLLESSRGLECLRDIPHVSLDVLEQFGNRYSTPASRVAARLGLEAPDWSVLAGMVDGEDEPSEVLRARSVDAIDATWATVETLLDCAAADPKAKLPARRVRASWLTALSNWADGIPAPDRARQWATEACQLGSMRGCDRVESMKKRNSVAIPVVPWLSFPLMGHAGLEVVVGRRELYLDGRPVSSLEQLSPALEDRLGAHHVLGRDVAVYADAGVEVARLSKVAETLSAFDLRPKLIVRDASDRLMALTIQSRTDLAGGPDPDPPSTTLRYPKAISRQLPTDTETASTGFELSAPSGTSWGELAEWLRGFGELPPRPHEAQRARHLAVGSAAAVPPVVLAP